MGDMMDMMGCNGGWAAWMVLLLLVVAASLVTVGVMGVKAAGRRRLPLAAAPATGDDEALLILRQRYARGEIDEEEFLRRQSALTPY